MTTDSPTPLPSTTSTGTPSRPPVGEFVAVGGRRFYTHRAGSGGTPIVLLPGAGTVGLDYYPLFVEAAAMGTAFLYDRSGTGWSDSIVLPRTPTEVVDELRQVLAGVGLEPPYIVVGHSLGGGYAQQFARRFPADVSGLLLLDPAHEDYPRYTPPVPGTDGGEVDLTSWEPPPAVIERFTALFREKYAAWPDEVREAVIDYHASCWKAGILESSNLAVIYEHLAAAPPIGDIPALVLTAQSLDPGSQLFMPDEWQREVIVGKARLNAALAASLPRGEHRVLPDASHSWMHAERPDAVVQALRDLMAMVGTG